MSIKILVKTDKNKNLDKNAVKIVTQITLKGSFKCMT